jgi:hypothetical protein
MAEKVARCQRCGRRMRSDVGWNVILEDDVIAAFLCPDCQRPEETAEAEVNDATMDVLGVDDGGKVTMRPKTDGDD